ncbi:MAG TPA: OmpA family protein [Polyangiaceae bacterium]|nr:OmpA family protein [Polyangiaceae bacterium]
MKSSIGRSRFVQQLAAKLGALRFISGAAGAVAAGSFAVLTLHSTAAHAQEKGFYLDRIQIGGAPDDGFATWRPYIPDKARVYGSATLGYTLNPLKASTVTDSNQVADSIGSPVRHQLITYLSAGAQLSKRIALDLQLPIGVEAGADSNQLTIAQVGAIQHGAGVGDLRAGLRLIGYESDDRKFRFGGGGALFFPTGNATHFMGDDQTTAYMYAAAEYDFGSFLLSGNLGPHFRPNRGINTLPNATLSIGSELRAAVGAFIFLRDGDLRLGGELFGTTGITSVCPGSTPCATAKTSAFFASENTSYEWLASGRFNLDKNGQGWAMVGGGTQISPGYGAPNLRLLGQIGWWTSIVDTKARSRVRKHSDVAAVEEEKDTDGDGFPDNIDLCPTIPEDKQQPRPDDGCPGISDRDNDGIADNEDSCPDDPEDKDQIQDEDGCPEDDADKDGIPDAQDACPLKPGVRSSDPKLNGCPAQKRKKIVESNGEIKLLEPIQFETGKATIKEVSFPILDEVVDLMQSRDEIRVGVYGHTDNKGGQWFNVKLSKDRAAAVMKYLTDHGIAAKRLESEGFGPNKPVDTNATEEGRAKNRRVEFKILSGQ